MFLLINTDEVMRVICYTLCSRKYIFRKYEKWLHMQKIVTNLAERYRMSD